LSSIQKAPRSHEIPENTIIIIFGASGDLTRRKLLPAIYHLSREELLPKNFKIIGLGRRIPLNNEFKTEMQLRVRQYCSHKMEDKYWNPIKLNLHSIRANYNDEDTFLLIKNKIEAIEKEWNEKSNRLFYFATNPSHFTLLIMKLSKFKLNINHLPSWTRIIIEKPFGLDLNSAKELNNLIRTNFNETQIYRVDHFLGKEAVQNILVFRMSNLIFQPLWNREFIDHIQITTFETVGVEGRVDFFEQTGVVRDMVQSHMLQILAFLTMEHPRSLEPELIRDEKVKLLNSIRRYNGDEIQKNTVRGQYSEGIVNSNLTVTYRNEDGVPIDSLVETFAVVKLFIDNYRWRDVPFYLRTGKRMSTRKTEIFIQLKKVNDSHIPMILSKQLPIPNTIQLEIQPRAGINITLGWKPAGLLTEVEPINLDLGGKAKIKEPKAYERLLVDTMRGDSTLFIRFDEIIEMWSIVDPIIKYWKEVDKKIMNGLLPDPFPNYPAGTHGPDLANEFIKKDGRAWNKL